MADLNKVHHIVIGHDKIEEYNININILRNVFIKGKELLTYVPAQILGCLLGVMLANVFLNTVLLNYLQKIEMVFIYFYQK